LQKCEKDERAKRKVLSCPFWLYALDSSPFALKNEMRYLQQAVSSAIRLSYKSPKRSIGWQQEHVHDLVADLYPGYQLAVSSISGQHSNRFHNSRILSNTVPLGFCCGGFS